jgi:hypothetical protein
MSSNSTKTNNNASTIKPEDALKKHDDMTKKVLAFLIVGSVLAIVVAMFMTAPTAHASDDVATALKEEVAAQTTASNTTAIENVTPEEVSNGGTCVATLPADSDLWDRVKNVFNRIGCDVVVSVDEATGDAEATKPVTAHVPATTTAPAAQ